MFTKLSARGCGVACTARIFVTCSFYNWAPRNPVASMHLLWMVTLYTWIDGTLPEVFIVTAVVRVIYRVVHLIRRGSDTDRVHWIHVELIYLVVLLARVQQVKASHTIGGREQSRHPRACTHSPGNAVQSVTSLITPVIAAIYVLINTK